MVQNLETSVQRSIGILFKWTHWPSVNRNGMKFKITKGKFLHCGTNHKIFLIYVWTLQRRWQRRKSKQVSWAQDDFEPSPCRISDNTNRIIEPIKISNFPWRQKKPNSMVEGSDIKQTIQSTKLWWDVETWWLLEGKAQRLKQLQVRSTRRIR